MSRHSLRIHLPIRAPLQTPGQGLVTKHGQRCCRVGLTGTDRRERQSTRTRCGLPEGDERLEGRRGRGQERWVGPGGLQF